MLRLISHEIKIRITQDEPFCAGCLKIDFHPRMRTLPFAVQYDAVAKFAVSDSLAQMYAEFCTWSCCC
jgi:hypothetical protein